MLIHPDCIPCILNMAIMAIRKLELSDTIERELFSDILTIPGLKTPEWNQTSPNIIEIVMKKITETVKDPDPFREEKNNLSTNLTFMLLSKCRPQTNYFNIDLHQPIIHNVFHS